MARSIRHRRGTAAQWTAANPVLGQGEIGYVTDTGEVRIGDGSTAWALLKGALSSAYEAALPNESPFWWTTEPVHIDGRVFTSTAGDNNDVWLHEWSQPTPGGAYWLRRYFMGHVTNDTRQDDHHAGGVAVAAGKPVVVFYSSHAYDNLILYRISDQNVDSVEPGALTFGPERSFELAATVTTAYLEVFTHGNDIWVMHRTGNNADRWSLTKFPAWATGTPTEAVVLSSADQFYAKGRLVGDTLRVAVADHPTISADNKVWYCEINLVTGSVAKSDGTVLGNLSGTGLPIAEASLELVYTATGSERPWIFDVGGQADPEIALTSGLVPPNFASTADYFYAKRVGGVWQVNDIAPVGSFLGGAYFPSIVFDPNVTGSVVLAREAGGTYYIERHVTTDGGVTWTPTVLDSATDTTLTRAFTVRSADASGPLFSVMATEIDSYPTYNGAWVSRFRPVGGTVQRHPDVDPSAPDRSPAAGVYLNGATGNYVTTPDSAATSLQAQRLEADVALTSWAPGTIQNLIGKEESTTQRSIRLAVNSDGKPLLAYSTDGATPANLIPSPALPFAPGERATLRVDVIPNYNGTQYRVTFWYKRPGDRQWTLHSRTQNTGAFTIFDSTSKWEIGSRLNGGNDRVTGTIYAASVRTVGGALVAGWRGDVQSTTQRDPKGNTWTVTGTGWAWTAEDPESNR